MPLSVRAQHRDRRQSAAGAVSPAARSLRRPRRSPPATWVQAAGIVAFLAAPVPPAAGAPAANVLVLYANSRLLPANIDFDRGLRTTFRAANRRVDLFDEFLDVPRLGDEPDSDALAAYLRQKYASRPPDVIVAAGENALEFLLHDRARLFPRAPVVHAGVSRSFLQALPPPPSGVVGTPLDDDGFRKTIGQALRWHPRASCLVLVTGAAEQDRRWEARLRGEVPRFEQRVRAEFLAGLPTGVLLERLRRLGSECVVFTPGFFADGDGRSWLPREAAQAIAAAAPAPVYGPFGPFIGTGVVGGYMVSFETVGREAGRTTLRVLEGARPMSLPLPERTPTTLNVDWRQVRRWGIDQAAIPGDAVVHFRVPTFFETYRTETVAAAAVFSLQAALIAWLLVERRRRRAAELAEQASRADLAHASRLAVAGELTGAIAHEINQPLGAILSNADAADLILESGADRRDVLRRILADIRRDDVRASEVIRRLRALLEKHEVEPAAFDLNDAVTEVELVLRAEATRRRVTLDVQRAPGRAMTFGDRIQIEQVLLNLVMNGMDAVADMPQDRRTVAVSVQQAAHGVGLAVRDRGHGIAPEHLAKVFDSFFTTKRTGMGLGLSIARTLVHAHGGSLRVENGVGEGAVFRVELPAADGAGTGMARQEWAAHH